ncbi:MAG: AAA family ATPase [Monoglobales bacterium]
MDNKKNIFFAIDLSDILFWLMKWKWVVIGVTILFALSGYIFSNVTYNAEYTATASMVVNSKSETLTQAGTTVDAMLTQNLIPTYTRILKSEKIAKHVMDKFDINLAMGVIDKMLEVSIGEESQVVYLKVSHADPYMAKNIANAVIQVAPAVMMEVVEAGSVNVLDYAVLPKQPEPPKTVQFITMLGLIGFLLISLIIVLLNFFVMKVKNSEDIEHKVGEMVLGEIPHATATNDKNKNYLHTGVANQGFVESNFMLAAVLKNQAQNVKPYKLIVTSTIAAEGKSTTSINMATALSDMGYKVLLIDIDMKKPNIVKQLELETGNIGGIEKVLMGNSLDENIMHDDRFGFDILPCVKATSATSKIFTAVKVEKAFDEFNKTDYDYIILDSSPANIVADTSVIVKYADGLLLVIKQYFARIKVINETIEKLKKAGANVIGTVLNDIRVFNAGTGYAFDYKYGYYYYYNETKGKRDKSGVYNVYDKLFSAYRTNYTYGYGDMEKELDEIKSEVKEDIKKEKETKKKKNKKD